MGDKFKVGDYGNISFTLRKKRKYPIPGEPFIETGFIMRAEVIESDSSHILLRDNDDLIYLVSKSRVRNFERCDKEKVEN